MTLREFVKTTADLDPDIELLVEGAPIEAIRHSEGAVALSMFRDRWDGEIGIARLYTAEIPEIVIHDGQTWIRRRCAICGDNERPHGVDGVTKQSDGARASWVCDTCVKRHAPHLLDELSRRRKIHDAQLQEDAGCEAELLDGEPVETPW